jgi:ABC-2 type transport system ATP-binding protein
LGPNGAGKTTTIRALLGLLTKISGEATIFGMDIQRESIEIRKKVAYLPGELGLYSNMTARQNLKYLLSLYEMKVSWSKVEDLATRLRLDMEKKVKELSKGNKQKIGNILVLAPDVDLYILDEPTSGLDPLMQAEFYKILKEHQRETKATVFLSSHLLPEVEKVADRVGIIREGSLVEVSSVTELKKMALKRIEIQFAEETDIAEKFRKISQDLIQNLAINNSQVNFLSPTTEIQNIIKEVISFDLKIEDINISSPALEDIFMQYYEIERILKEEGE